MSTIDREDLRDAAEGHLRYGGGGDDLANGVLALLDALEQAEAERDELARRLARANNTARSEGFVPVADYDAREEQWRGYEESLRAQIDRETNRAERAEARTQAVRELHQKSAAVSHLPRYLRETAEDAEPHHLCTECPDRYPCPTIRALDGTDTNGDA